MPDAADGGEATALEDAADAVPCPSCGFLVTPPPARTRRCPACREQIVVRRVDGRTVYLSESAITVFEAERLRDAQDEARDTERHRWLRLAATVGAPGATRAKLAEAPPSEQTVDAARALYTRHADEAVRTAKRLKRWADVSRIRRAQAAAMFAAAGSPVPLSDDIAAVHREAMLALLRSFVDQGTGAELVGAGCCPACRADDGKTFKISSELQVPRLPHATCPKGICPCDWWIGVVERKRRRRSRPAA